MDNVYNESTLFFHPMLPRPQNVYQKYHAHVYCCAETVAQARALCEQAGSMFGVTVGRMHQKLVGPHPHWSCQLAFDREQFGVLLPWLDTHRNGLDILVHGLTGNDLADHTDHASWLGDATPLRLEMFGYSTETRELSH